LNRLWLANILAVQILIAPRLHYDLHNDGHDNNWDSHGIDDKQATDIALNLALTQLINLLLNEKLTAVLLVLVENAKVPAKSSAHEG